MDQIFGLGDPFVGYNSIYSPSELHFMVLNAPYENTRNG